MNLIPFQFGNLQLRTLTDDAGAPWFVAGDAAAALGYRDASNLTRILDEDEKGTHNVSTLGGAQEISIISESGLYSAIFNSRKSEAKRFRKWVTEEVLPSIRKTGAYAMVPANPVDALGEYQIALKHADIFAKIRTHCIKCDMPEKMATEYAMSRTREILAAAKRAYKEIVEDREHEAKMARNRQTMMLKIETANLAKQIMLEYKDQ